MAVPILEQSAVLIASVQSAPTDADLMLLQQNLREEGLELLASDLGEDGDAGA
ncbi:MAG TPA: hypothetical protein VGP50_08340 [Stellaceae bacterium]|jgi:hypothetical protein|nr:hypothetical protein [Stellaceae bacterium]